MSVFKTTYSRTLRVIPSDNSDIPFPSVAHSGVNTGTGTNLLISAAANFIFDNVKCGDIVYNISDSTSATVVSVESETHLTMNANLFSVGGKSFIVYVASSQSGLGNTGCYLYVGGTGNVSVTTIGGDQVIFNGVLAGTTLPIQVLKVKSTGTTATLINALW